MVMIVVVSVILNVASKQLFDEHKAIVRNVATIVELAAVTILCVDKTGTLTTNELTVDRVNVKKYSDMEIDEIIHYAAIATHTENPDFLSVENVTGKSI
jgi:H+-transporting ATPase